MAGVRRNPNRNSRMKNDDPVAEQQDQGTKDSKDFMLLN